MIQKLVDIQSRLKAPKSQENKFGRYHYRSCEDILEAVKPLLKEHKIAIMISDSVELIGDRHYVKATVTLSDGSNVISSHGYAREELQKKGMDNMQLTGATSSYARKYALNGLLAIDDTKDSDAMEPSPTTSKEKESYISEAQIKRLYAIANQKGIKEESIKKAIATEYKKESVTELTKKEYDTIIKRIQTK